MDFFLLIAALITWSYFALLDEVTTGSGKVIPTSRAQVIQSLEGGILLSLEVSEGDIVERGQVLAQLDPTQFRSDAEETAARYRAGLARMVRLTAEVNGTPLTFPEKLEAYGELREKERRLFKTRKSSLAETLGGWGSPCGW
ncbi:biotin/lipoyl-binding protein [Microbulbifer taiwanensis]|uniref:biotin/lipoyl-binding protein n=1 Tax=Microbulbifer taiwanensis TaxID=986746 RepID=UPI00360B883E